MQPCLLQLILLRGLYKITLLHKKDQKFTRHISPETPMRNRLPGPQTMFDKLSDDMIIAILLRVLPQKPQQIQGQENLSTGQQSTGQQSTGQQSTGKQSTGKQSTGEPSTGGQSTEKQSTEKQSTGEQSTDSTYKPWLLQELRTTMHTQSQESTCLYFCFHAAVSFMQCCKRSASIFAEPSDKQRELWKGILLNCIPMPWPRGAYHKNAMLLLHLYCVRRCAVCGCGHRAKVRWGLHKRICNPCFRTATVSLNFVEHLFPDMHEQVIGLPQEKRRISKRVGQPMSVDPYLHKQSVFLISDVLKLLQTQPDYKRGTFYRSLLLYRMQAPNIGPP